MTAAMLLELVERLVALEARTLREVVVEAWLRLNEADRTELLELLRRPAGPFADG